jgi:hypothetical protein
VLTRLRYDAHWLRQASGVHHHPRGPYTTAEHRLSLSALYPLVGFGQLQGIAHPYTGWEPVPSWVLPLTAPSSPDMRNRFPHLLLPVHRFSQPPDKNDVRSDLQVYSTPQALLGFGLQRSKPDRSGAVPSPRLLRRYPVLHGFLPCVACGSRPPGHRAITLVATLQHTAPCRLETTGDHLGLGPTLKLCSRPDLPPLVKWFHPFDASAPLLAFLSFRVFLTNGPGLAPAPFQGCYPPRVLLPPEMATP